MEAQTFAPAFHSNSTIPSIKIPLEPVFVAPAPRRLSLTIQHCVSSQGTPHWQISVQKQYYSVVIGEEDSKPVVKWKKLAVFVSGGGSNSRSIHEACVRGSVNGDVVVLVTNKEGCGGAEYATDKGIPVILFPRTREEPDGLSPKDLVTSLGYAGPTIHFVDEHYDTGRILGQRVVLVLASDTAEDLAARVLKEEHQLYVEVTAAQCEERIIWREAVFLSSKAKTIPKAIINSVDIRHYAL